MFLSMGGMQDSLDFFCLLYYIIVSRILWFMHEAKRFGRRDGCDSDCNPEFLN